jgi:DNA-binding response OmpR family regulator
MSSSRSHNVQVRVLVVEDHVALANRIGEALHDAGFAVEVAATGVGYRL